MTAASCCQAVFHQRWRHLLRARVRALAWLLDAPSLLDANDARWHGRLASLPAGRARLDAWLRALDRDPTMLDTQLARKRQYRLGLYAEQLMAFYFARHDVLHAHGVQVRGASNTTLGEFDFLLRQARGLVHIEFATKFYLYVPQAGTSLDALVGPNLADSLGRKLRKIFGQQLALGALPDSSAVLGEPLVAAEALVKGWLFYPPGCEVLLPGIAREHCRGFWCSLGRMQELAPGNYLVLPKLQWLAPFRAYSAQEMCPRDGLAARLQVQFRERASPVLVARLMEVDGALEEVERGFIVPDGWEQEAAARAAS